MSSAAAYHSPHRGPRPGLTLIELLVCISIIAVLASLIVPSIAMIREKTQRIACSSNFRQCALALYALADDHDGTLPRVNSNDDMDADVYSMPGYPNLADRLQPYIGDFNVWRCPAATKTTIDDPRNTSAFLRASIIYWPHLSFGSGSTAFSSPGNIVHHTADTALIQDELYRYNGNFRANHSRGGTRRVPYPTNPALEMFFGGVPRGANILYGDGHVSWHDMNDQMVPVYNRTASAFYSSRDFWR